VGTHSVKRSAFMLIAAPRTAPTAQKYRWRSAAGLLTSCSLRGTRSDGTKIGMRVRATACYREIDGMWTLVHEHQSVRFNPQTGTASLNLEP
jgi:hypothetical protein